MLIGPEHQSVSLLKSGEIETHTYHVTSGQNVTLTCGVMSGAASTGFQWLRDALPLSAGAADKLLPLPQPSNANDTRLARRYYRIEVCSVSFYPYCFALLPTACYSSRMVGRASSC
jgi:hypothetical protein